MATLKEVADLAGVSIATASMSLNQGAVKESTRKRVLDCAKLLNYVPNRIGRTLNTGKSNTIALLMMTSVQYADIVHKTSLFYYLQQGVLQVVDRANYSLRLEVKAHEDPGLGDYFERVIGDKTLDGIIIVPQYRRDYPFISLRHDAACLLWQGREPPGSGGLPWRAVGCSTLRPARLRSGGHDQRA
jgi:DNA-binding LacI/PurR family transcriptional regulator